MQDDFIAKERRSRASLSTRHQLNPTWRLEPSANLWESRTSAGSGFRLGLARLGVMGPGSEAYLRFRFDENAYGSTMAGLFALRKTLDQANIEFAYELTRSEYDAFDDDSEFIDSHLLSARWGQWWRRHWHVSLSTDFVLGDDEDSLSASLYLQRRF